MFVVEYRLERCVLKMKYISFAIPSYNSEKYLHHAVDTILSGGEDVEIIIVNDGSSDNTAVIADAYAAEYPSIVKVIHKQNGGHGSGVNAGLNNASGLFFKVVDSDDWVNEKALKALIDTLKSHVSKGLEADLYITNFIYDHALDGKQFVRKWNKHFPVNRFCSWNDAKTFVGPQVILMHSLLYKTDVLRNSGTVLPEHTFYVDNIYAYRPLPFAKKLFYLDVNLYHYFIGRDDQSVNIKNMTKRYDQQIRVMRNMLEAYSYKDICSFDKQLKKYMLHDLSALMMTTMMFCCSGGEEPERKEAYEAMWNDLKERDPDLYDYLTKKGLPSLSVWMPWKMRGKAMLWGYNVLCKVIKLG